MTRSYDLCGGAWGGGRHRIIGAVVCSVVLVGVSGCTSSGSSPSGRPRSTSAPTPSHVISAPSVPAPSGTLSVVPSVAQESLQAVPITSVAGFGNGVTVSLTSAPTNVTGQGRGVTTGAPAVRFRLTIRNGSTASISLDSVEVATSYGPGTPAVPAPGDSKPLSGQLAPGASDEGEYTFVIPADARSRVTVTAWYQAGVPVAQFTGSVH